MSERDEYPAGVPCWVDTLTPDVGSARHFYGELFGWEYEGPGSSAEDPDAEYYVARVRNRDVAGIGTAPVAGVPPAWNTYIAVDDIEATIAAAREAGAEILSGAIDASPAGKLAALADPVGAAVCVWEAETRAGAQVVNEPSAWSMSRLHTDATAEAREFYGRVFDWTFDDLDLGGGSGVTLCRRSGYVGGEPRQPVPRDSVAVMLPADGDASAESYWSVDFWVGDADEAAARVGALGGGVLVPPFDIPGFRSAVLTDPAGAPFSVSELRM
jgi:predicted enzyme related to lactoylglutathione lyase